MVPGVRAPEADLSPGAWLASQDARAPGDLPVAERHAIERGVVARLYPNRAQSAALRQWQGSLRFVWNDAWAWCKTQHESVGRWPSKAEIRRHVLELKTNPETQWIGQLPAHALLAVADDLLRSMLNWFEHRASMPRFRAKHQRQPSIYIVNQRTYYQARAGKLPKIGTVRYRAGDRPAGRLLSSRIYRAGDKWFMSSVFECDPVETVPAPRVERVGIDMGLKALATLFDGERTGTVRNPKALRAHEIRLRRYQRRVSRRQTGSARHARAKGALGRLHRRIASIRNDAAHKATTSLVERYGTLVVESLNVAGMQKNRALARSVHDAGMAEFLRMLRYKATWSRRTLVEANAWFPSTKLCSRCGALHDMPLSSRWFSCGCGNEMDRDENAARNLYAYREEPGNAGVMPKTRGESVDQALGATRSPVPDVEPRTSKTVTSLEVRPSRRFRTQGTQKSATLVPRAGLEPALLAEPDFESGVSTNFTTEASGSREV
jgi:putative transposase